jgi:hypothetical protein
MDSLNKDISTHIGAGIRSDIDAEFDTESTVIDDARKLVALSDAAAAALPAARTRHAGLCERHVAANAVSKKALDDMWPFLAVIPAMGQEIYEEGVRRFEAKEVAMEAMWKAGSEEMAAEAEVNRLNDLRSSPEVTEARLIAEAANNRKVLRQLVGVRDAKDLPRKVRMM